MLQKDPGEYLLELQAFAAVQDLHLRRHKIDMHLRWVAGWVGGLQCRLAVAGTCMHKPAVPLHGAVLVACQLRLGQAGRQAGST